MKKTELNNIFTAKVNEYLAKGYTFNTESMAGHQGEIAKVDLTDGEEVIRILLDKRYHHSFNEPYWLTDCFAVTVGKAPEAVPHQDWPTIWNEKLEVIDRVEFYAASHYKTEKLISKEEAIANAKKSTERAVAKHYQKVEEEITDKAVIKALVPYIQTLKGCKSVKARHITNLWKESLTDGTYRYKARIEKKNTTKVEVLSSTSLKRIRTGC